MSVFRVEKVVLPLMLAALLAIPTKRANAQCPDQVSLQVVPLASINLGDLIVSDGIQSNTLFATIFISTNNTIEVKMTGTLDVKLPGDRLPRKAASFTTQLFTVNPPGRNILNTDIGLPPPEGILIESDETVSEVLDDIREIGRLAGEFNFTIEVFDANGNLCGDPIVHPEFITNPAQILRTGPTDGSQEREENVVFSWTGDAGFNEYELSINVREGGQSPEDALGTNQPPIFSGSTGTQTSVNLRNLSLQRQVLPGMELVWQVTGIVQGVGGGVQIPSDIGSFHILNPNSALMSTTVSRLIIFLQQLGYSDFASQLQGVEITLTGEFELDDGTLLSLEELTSLITYLEANSDNVIGVGIE